MLKLLYFAWVRERTGHSSEDVPLPDGVTTVGELVAWQRSRGEGYLAAFENDDLVRVAVNQNHVDFSHTIKDGDEIAFFPPVTGG